MLYDKKSYSVTEEDTDHSSLKIPSRTTLNSTSNGGQMHFFLNYDLSFFVYVFLQMEFIKI